MKTDAALHGNFNLEYMKRLLGFLVLIAFISGLIFGLYLWGKSLWRENYALIELARSGHSTLATVNSCQKMRGRGTLGSGSGYYYYDWWNCEFAYDGHVGHMDCSNIERLYDAGPGQQFPLLYLPSNPSVFAVGDAGDSAWTISVKNHGWFNSVDHAFTSLLLFVVAPSIILGAVLRRAFRKSRASAA